MKCYRDLVVWQEGLNLVVDVYTLSRKLPYEERFVLCNQMQRAAVSIPSNIAEGHARTSRKEFQHYLSISLGSLAELETHLILAQKLNFVDEVVYANMFKKMDVLGKRLRSLQKSLQKVA
jgi:four helix bundle protein